MASYAFQTAWLLDAPVDRVYEVVRRPEDYPRWWEGVRSVEALEAGDDRGVGQTDRYVWRSVLPYTLTFDARVTRVDAPHVIEARVTGQLDGVGTWRLFESAGGTAVIFDWRVATTRRWMNLLGPLARPVFVWNHDRVMAAGGAGLARELGVRPGR